MRWLLRKIRLVFIMLFLILMLPLLMLVGNPFKLLGFYLRKLTGRLTWSERRAEVNAQWEKYWLGRAGNDQTLLQQAMSLAMKRQGIPCGPIDPNNLDHAISELRTQYR